MAENVLGALADLQEESKPEAKEETNEAVSSLMKVETPNPTSVLFCGSADFAAAAKGASGNCLLYTSPSPRDYAASRMPSSA